ncbi:hypothetical protein [Nonomuraea salmonea]
MAVTYARTGHQPALLLLEQPHGWAAAVPGLNLIDYGDIPLLVLSPEVHSGDLAASPASTLHLPDKQQVSVMITRAARTAQDHHRPVLLRTGPNAAAADESPKAPTPDATALKDLSALLLKAHRPIFIAGRGAASAAAPLERLAEQAGALLATTLGGHGMFSSNPWNIGIAGTLASPETAELLGAADLVVAWGCTLDTWTTRRGTLLSPQARLAQIDINPAALGLHHRIDLGVAGDTRHTAEALLPALPEQRTGYRSATMRQRVLSRQSRTYEAVPGRIDPRSFFLLLDALLPAERTLVVEQGTAMGPAVSHLRIPDAAGFCLVPAPGLGLAGGIGAALARPDRLAVTVLDAGSALMAVERETAAGLGAPLLIVVCDESAEHAPAGDLIAGWTSAVVRCPADMTAVSAWLGGPRNHPLLLHAKVTRMDWWLAELAATCRPEGTR